MELTKEAAALERRIMREWGIKDHTGRLLLRTAMEAWTEMKQAQEILAAEGTVTKDRFGCPKLHPATQREKEARAHLLQSLRALDLDLETLGTDDAKKAKR